jgi:hypothetical protein
MGLLKVLKRKKKKKIIEAEDGEAEVQKESSAEDQSSEFMVSLSSCD